MATRDRGDCQNGVEQVASRRVDLDGESHGEAKRRFVEHVVRNRYDGRPTRLSEAVRAVYGGDYSNTEYKRLSRFASRSDLLRTESAGGFVELEPRPAAFETASLESRSKQSAKTQEGAGIRFDTLETGSTAQRVDESDVGAGDDGRTAQRFPKDRVRRTLAKRVRLDGGDSVDGDGLDVRRGVFRELAQYREDIGDKWQYFERLRGVGSQYLVLPYLTRYNDHGKAADTQRRFRRALGRASRRFDRAAVVSLTVDPNRFESHSEATEAIQSGVSNLVQREAYQLGSRPANVKVFDFQRNGLPHYHVVLFGVGVVDGETETGEATISTEHVRDYWDETAGIGEQVDVRPAYSREGERGSWILHDDDDGRVSLGYYLGKRIRGLMELATADVSDLFERVESGDLSLWRHALFWAYEKQYCTCSPSLRADSRDDGLPAVRRWRYVGTASFEQIPSHVVDGAILCRRRPPPD